MKLVTTTPAIDAVTTAVHEAHNTIGSLRLAVTALQVSPLARDEPWRSLLADAEQETTDLALGLDALVALVTCLDDDGEAAPCDGGRLLERVADGARRDGTEIVIGHHPADATVVVRVEAAVDALAAIATFLSRGAPVAVSGSLEQERYMIVVAPESSPDAARLRWAERLASAIGGAVVPDGGPLIVSLPAG